MAEQKKILPSHYLYPQVQRECAGVTSPVYWPDETETTWRCTCGQENPAAEPLCRSCGVSRKWLTAHFDRGYLANQEETHQAEDAEVRRRERQKEAHRKTRSRRTQRWLTLAAAAALLAGFCLLLFLKLLPDARFRRAEELRDGGKYLAAAEQFDRLGKNGLAAECRLLFARQLAGKEDVCAVSSAAQSFWHITAAGELRADADGLEASGLSFDPLRIPDVVDNILVTSLAPRAFASCDFLTAVLVPDSVTVLGERCFFGCAALREITLPDGLTELGERAFSSCRVLEALSLPEGITEIPIRLCNNCQALERVTLSPALTAVFSYAFSGCAALREIRLPVSLTSVGAYAFAGCDSLSAVYGGSAADFSRVTVGEENAPLTQRLTFDTSNGS